MADFSRDVRRILREAGCYFVRQGKGDHEIWYSPITSTTFPVNGKIVSRHSANGVLKDAGLPKAFEGRAGSRSTARPMKYRASRRSSGPSGAGAKAPGMTIKKFDYSATTLLTSYRDAAT